MSEEAKKTPAAKKPEKKGGFGQWLRDMKGEMKKIVWPTKEATAKSTGVVIAMCAIIGVFLWLFDFAAISGVQTLIAVLR